MTYADRALGKYHAVRMLMSMIAWFDNWRELWSCYRNGTELPPLRFRRGFVLNHRPEDQSLVQFHEIFRDKNYRRCITEPDRGTIVDIGANIGTVTLDWTTRISSIRIHAYEPHPATFAVLRANIEMNHLTRRVTTYREAVGGHTGTLALRGGGSSIETSAYGSGAAVGAFDEVSVPMVSLDAVIERCIGDGLIALVKIDAEGAEAEILEGARPKTLQEIWQFVIEYHESLCADALARCIRVLTPAGFRCLTRPVSSDQGLLYARREEGSRRRAV